MTIQLIDSDEMVAYTASVTGNSADYSLADVAEGTYTMQVSKKGHATYVSTIVVEADMVLDIQLFPLGDVNRDGKVNNQDRMILTRYLAKWSDYPADVVNMDAADVNSDGKVNNQDRMILTRHLAKWTGYETLG